MSLANRKQCLWDLKEIGYQVAAASWSLAGTDSGDLVRGFAVYKGA